MNRRKTHDQNTRRQRPGPGADTHKELQVAAVINAGETVSGTRSVPTTRTGYRATLAWIGGSGDLARIGLEGTGSYGAGLTRHFAKAGIMILKVDWPDRSDRRSKGKDNDLDAINAARATRRRPGADQGHGNGLDQAGAKSAYIAGYLRTLRTYRASGVILISAVIMPETRQLLGPNIPIISVAISDKSGSPSVAIDDEQAAYDATRHLLRLGHRRIGLLTGDPATRRRSTSPSPASAASSAP
jgi:hypothetical protein